MTLGDLEGPHVKPLAAAVLGFFFSAAVLIVPVLFAVAETPLHDGSDVPSPHVLVVTVLVTFATSALIARWVYTRFSL